MPPNWSEHGLFALQMVGSALEIRHRFTEQRHSVDLADLNRCFSLSDLHIKNNWSETGAALACKDGSPCFGRCDFKLLPVFAICRSSNDIGEVDLKRPNEFVEAFAAKRVRHTTVVRSSSLRVDIV